MFTAQTLNVLIASPGDTKEYRDTIRATILDWNDSNAQYYQVTLLPVMWETHSYPGLGRPQGIINGQIVADADILIGTFWTRLGTPTIVAESGTAEEIDQFEKSGRPVLLYFCEAPASMLALDATEIERLKSYRRDMQSRALLGSYLTADELRGKVREDLTRMIRDMKNDGRIPSLAGQDVVPSTAESPVGGNRNVTDGPDHNLADLRQTLVGYKAKWQGQFVSLDYMDPSIDRRRDLAREISRVLWEMVQRVGERCPEATVLGSLSTVAAVADEVANLRLYIDGGKSFNTLNDGCRKAIDAVQAIIDEPWECGPES